MRDLQIYNQPQIRAVLKIKLNFLKLSLPNFHGCVTDWLPFWESFDSAINQNSDLSEIEKFRYLRSLLQGSALNVISGLTMSSACKLPPSH